MEYTTTVKLFVDGTAGEWLACAIVYLYDRDIVSRDDFLGMGITNEYGEATFTFHRDGFADIDDRIGGPRGERRDGALGRAAGGVRDPRQRKGKAATPGWNHAPP